jgi:hypothetical protein
VDVRDELRLICYPRDDVLFESDVRAALAQLDPAVSDEAERIAATIEALRDRYPALRIRSRDPIAAFDDAEPTWHVYRDGGPSRTDHVEREAR